MVDAIALFMLWFIALGTALGSPAAVGSVFKCSGEKGAVVYQDSACAAGAELRNFDTDPPTLSIVPGAGSGSSRPVATVPPAASSARTTERTSKARRGGAAAQTEAQADKGQAAERRFIRVGMSEAEVMQKIGRPNIGSTAVNHRGKLWSYLPSAGDPNTITTITLAGGSVTNVERKLVR